MLSAPSVPPTGLSLWVAVISWAFPSPTSLAVSVHTELSTSVWQASKHKGRIVSLGQFLVVFINQEIKQEFIVDAKYLSVNFHHLLQP